jgi:hypothetical protein
MAIQDVSQQTKQNDRGYSHPNRIMASPACYWLAAGLFLERQSTPTTVPIGPLSQRRCRPLTLRVGSSDSVPTKRTKCHVISIGSLSCAVFSHYFAANNSASFISADVFFAFLFCPIRSCFDDDDDAGFCHVAHQQ